MIQYNLQYTKVIIYQYFLANKTKISSNIYSNTEFINKRGTDLLVLILSNTTNIFNSVSSRK